MKNWSTYQLAVFDNVAHGTGHTVVNAVAGSGKTTTIEAAVQHIPPGKRTLFVAFNKAIAEELGRRLQGRGVEVSTLHSYGLKTITASLGRLRIERDRVDGFCEALHGSERETFELRRDLCKIVSLAKGSLAGTVEEVDAIIDQFGADSVNGNRELFIKDVLTILEMCKDTAADGQIDFDDMIWLPVVLNLPQRKFDRVFGDEIQDFNRAQIELMLRALAPDGRFLGVGDPRQAIYRFRGADENAFNNVKERLGALELPLSVCYRCCRSVVFAAQEIVPTIESTPDAEEGSVEHVSYAQMKRDAQPGDFILSRSNAPIIGLCMALLKEGRHANIQGRDVGASLAAFVKKSRTKSVTELRDYVEAWKDAECARLAKKRRDTQAVEDRAACILALSEGANSIAAVLSNIESLFADRDDDSRIILSTTHKAKGLERDRVWVLRATYRKRDEVEEDNLYYVAVTRAKRQLVFVAGLGKDEE